jgi:predicted methyltransferase
MRIVLAILFSLATISAQQIVPPGGPYPFPADPLRDPWQKPDEVIASLSFSSSETVAVIEDGYPYFAPRIAGHAKKVYAVNSDPLALQGPRGSSPDFSPVVDTDSDPGVSSLNVDTVIMVNTLRFIPTRPLYFLAMLAGIKPGGRLVIIDNVFPTSYPTAVRITDAILKAELAVLGFKFSQQFTFLNYQYFLVFQR